MSYVTEEEIAAVAAPLTVAAKERSDLITQLRIRDAPTYALANEALLFVKAEWTRIDGERKKIVAPIDAARKAAQGFFAAPLDALASAERYLKAELLRYGRETEAARVAFAEAGAPVMLAPPTPVEGVRTQVTERWEIVDSERVPRAFCSPDLGKIRAYLSSGGVRAIPGVRFYQEETIVASRGGSK